MANWNIEPGITLNILINADVDDGYIIDTFVEFVQARGLGDEIAAQLRERFRSEIEELAVTGIQLTSEGRVDKVAS